jgi:hypothetical protein
MAKTIRVPPTPSKAFNPSRPVSSLLKAHIANLEAVVSRKVGAAENRKPRTEGQASRYIAALTEQMQSAASPLPPPVTTATTATTPPPTYVAPPAKRRTRTARKKKAPAKRRAGRGR